MGHHHPSHTHKNEDVIQNPFVCLPHRKIDCPPHCSNLIRIHWRFRLAKFKVASFIYEIDCVTKRSSVTAIRNKGANKPKQVGKSKTKPKKLVIPKWNETVTDSWAILSYSHRFWGGDIRKVSFPFSTFCQLGTRFLFVVYARVQKNSKLTYRTGSRQKSAPRCSSWPTAKCPTYFFFSGHQISPPYQHTTVHNFRDVSRPTLPLHRLLERTVF